MRWIFISLVFANLLLYLYFWQQQNTVPELATVEVTVPKSSQNIKLVSEVPELLAAQPAPAPLSHKRSELCYSAGPFAEYDAAQHLIARANALGFTSTINEIETVASEPAQYWVLVPSRRNREEAMRTLRELQIQKIDSYIITQGENAEGVSIGLFRNKDSAEALQKKVAALAIPVELKVLNKNTKEYWVEVNETSQMNEALRAKILAGEQNTSWELVNCSKK